MTYKLFLDDERSPLDDSWTVFRTVNQAMSYVHEFGPPTHMSLDHDLGANEQTGYDFVKQYVELLFEKSNDDKHYDFLEVNLYVHSQNPVGKLNMELYWKDVQKFFGNVEVWNGDL